MTIPRLWAHGAASIALDSSGRYTLTASEIARLDDAVQRAVDKSFLAADPLTGPFTLASGAGISLDSPTSKWRVNGGTAKARTATGGRIACNDDDFPQFSATRDRTPFRPFHGSAGNFGGGHAKLTGASSLQNLTGAAAIPAGVTPTFSWFIDNSTESLQAGTHDSGAANGMLVVPITFTHDGAQSIAISVDFVVNPARAHLPLRFPAAALYRYDPFLNTVVVQSGAWSFFSSGSLSTYKNSGNTNSIVTTCTATNDVSKYLYVLVVIDEDYNAETLVNNPICNAYQGYSVQYRSSSLRYQ